MNVHCICGGTYRRSDIKAVYAPNVPGHFIYQDTDDKVATWKCDKCLTVRTQRKRQPRPNSRLVADVLGGMTPGNVSKAEAASRVQTVMMLKEIKKLRKQVKEYQRKILNARAIAKQISERLDYLKAIERADDERLLAQGEKEREVHIEDQRKS